MKEERIGTPRRNLIIETAGIIRILVGDKYYDLDFKNSTPTNKDGSKVDSNFIVTYNIESYLTGEANYPGDGKIIFAIYSGIYYTDGGLYYPMTIQESSKNNGEPSTFDSTVRFNGTPVFSVTNDLVINNLNADLLDGYHASEFAKKSDINLTLNEIHTNDGEFNYANGKLDVPNISADKISADILKFEKLDGAIVLGVNTNLTYYGEFFNDKLGIYHGINLLKELYDLYIDAEFITEKTFLELASELFEPVNNDWDFTLPVYEEYDEDDLLSEIFESELYFKPKNLDLWKEIKTNENISLYNRLLSNIYLDDVSDKYSGSTFIFTSDTISELTAGYKFSGFVSTDSDSNDINIDLIITGIDEENGLIYAKSDYQSIYYKNTNKFESSLLIPDVEDSTDIIQKTINYDIYDVPDDFETDITESIYIESISDIVGYFGNYKGQVNDRLFYKLRSTGGFIGLNEDETPFLEIDGSGVAKIKELDDTKEKVSNIENLLNSYVSKPILQFTKSSDDSDPVIIYYDSAIFSQTDILSKVNSTWWTNNSFNAIMNTWTTQDLQYSIVVQGNFDNPWWYQASFTPTTNLGLAKINIKCLREIPFSSDMMNGQDSFTATIYGHFKL